jgi:hypothetical protein
MKVLFRSYFKMPHFYNMKNAKPLTLSGEERLKLFLLDFNIGLFAGIRLRFIIPAMSRERNHSALIQVT